MCKYLFFPYLFSSICFFLFLYLKFNLNVFIDIYIYIYIYIIFICFCVYRPIIIYLFIRYQIRISLGTVPFTPYFADSILYLSIHILSIHIISLQISVLQFISPCLPFIKIVQIILFYFRRPASSLKPI